ncbi:MAG: phenylacetate-CoA oxygenase subunit PaaJ [Acidimicrobiia bacterium]|nr:phenylacetate-CoA oxygenase subunit PaaJ [Acidimicrobiia bacterium]MDH4365712.1 phenylacetate-CoA oxygenase subunit PaaJ [Acidimicrobiia bacterium]
MSAAATEQAVTSPGDGREALHAALAAVPDPEIPVLTLADLGVLRSIEEIDGRVVVTITPTYSGCPAMAQMAAELRAVLERAGVEGEVRTVLSPAWSTDWMSAEGRAKLEAFGIAPPPVAPADGPVPVSLGPRRADAQPTCPQCHSARTDMVSEFGSTACKALYRCLDCLEPFDYFKGLQ